MTAEQIIKRFELYTDDTTELSTSEELDLLNDKLREIYEEKDWEFLRKTFSGTTESDGSILLPSDFDDLMVNHSSDDTSEFPNEKVIYSGDKKSIYRVIPIGNRNKYINDSSVCWVDRVNSKIDFNKSIGSGASVEFDYKQAPDDLIISNTPILPTQFHKMIVFSMLVDDDIIQKSDRPNVNINQAKYDNFMRKLNQYNANQYFI
jgi:hypothetical protein